MRLDEYAEKPTLRTREVKEILGGCSDDTLKRLVKRGHLSEPFRPSQRLTLYDTQEVFALLHRFRKQQQNHVSES